MSWFFLNCGTDSMHVVFSLATGEFVAQFKFTVLLMANGPMRITNGPLEPEFYKSEHEVQDADLKALLQTSASRKTQKKKKKKVNVQLCTAPQ
ncbi:PA2G4 protein, partial [Polyodon spathula]|nr:PA2G4 protein [Polyodon spathula]